MIGGLQIIICKVVLYLRSWRSFADEQNVFSVGTICIRVIVSYVIHFILLTKFLHVHASLKGLTLIELEPAVYCFKFLQNNVFIMFRCSQLLQLFHILPDLQELFLTSFDVKGVEQMCDITSV